MQEANPNPYYSWWNRTSEDPKWFRYFSNFVFLTGFAFMAMQLTGGVVRWVLDMVGASALTYIPNLMMLMCVLVVLASEIFYGRLQLMAFLFLVLVALAFTVGTYNTGRASQSAFGLWVLLPFLFGISTAPILMEQFKLRPAFFIFLFACASGGVIVHNFVSYPWVGVSYQIGGVEIEGAREWQAAGGASRLSGLARSSFDVAGQIIVASGLLSLYIKSPFLRIFLWAACGFSISLSTSKGILLALLMTLIVSESLIRGWKLPVRAIFSIGILWLFVPPILGWTVDWSQAARTDIDNPLYGSFIDRMNDMWPRAWELGVDFGLPLLGRGLGGIGVPVSVFEPALANAGDNLWVYLMVVLGALSIPFFVAGYIQIYKYFSNLSTIESKEVVILAVIVNWYGGVSNILEHAVLALTFGILCRYLASPPNLRNTSKV
jgi:hypothetical protein